LRESKRVDDGCFLLSAYRTGAAAGSGCHGIGDVHNSKTTSAIIGHFRTLPMVLCFSIPKQKKGRKVHLAVKMQLPK
jgi:hypothetical protein